MCSYLFLACWTQEPEETSSPLSQSSLSKAGLQSCEKRGVGARSFFRGGNLGSGVGRELLGMNIKRPNVEKKQENLELYRIVQLVGVELRKDRLAPES